HVRWFLQPAASTSREATTVMTDDIQPKILLSQRQRDAAAINETIAVLASLFPPVFAAEPWMPHRPLKVGIYHDLVATGLLSAGEAHAALACYTRRGMYLTALVAAGARVDLDGQPVGRVTAGIEQRDGLSALKRAWQARQHATESSPR